MTDAPERIFASEWEAARRGKHTMGGYTNTPIYLGSVEYIRADIHAAAIARAEQAEAERDRFEAALGRACLVGGTTYLLERAERAEAEFAMARTDADQLRVDLRKAETALAVAEEGLRVIALCVLSLSAGADAENRRHAGFVLAKIAALKGGAE